MKEWDFAHRTSEQSGALTQQAPSFPKVNPGKNTIEQVIESDLEFQHAIPHYSLSYGPLQISYNHHRLGSDCHQFSALALRDLQNRYNMVLEVLRPQSGQDISEGSTDTESTTSKSNAAHVSEIHRTMRTRALEVTEVALYPNTKLQVPTLEECLRIKAFLVCERSSPGDYRDLVALVDILGETGLQTLRIIDTYYEDGGVRTPFLDALISSLASANDIDTSKTAPALSSDPSKSPYSNWQWVSRRCQQLASKLIEQG